jgi:hypothetical protein
LKEKRLLLTSFLVSENITEWDLIFFVNILCESNTTSGRRCGCGGSRSGGHGFGGRRYRRVRGRTVMSKR